MKLKQLNIFGEEDEVDLPPTLNELYEFARQKAKELWNREFDISIVLYKRKWRRRLAAYCVYLDGSQKPFIKMSQIVNQSRTRKEIFDILLHEMVHWHLHTTGQPFSDGDQNFVAECLKVGAPISEVQKAQKALKKFKETKE
ncbi:SprT-like domain-containing protein [Metabacillus fastidiosus]|uniref:SprT-like domain-containing protein n=1 Tax=Metabacillus fastidiosus TaxID=1458 RepID=UPI003D2AE73D